jgi:anti-anti-sigma factor
MPRTPAKSRLAKSGEPAFGCTSGSSVRGAAWVCVAGELNLVTAPRLERAVRQATGRARLVVVDLRGLTRVDAAGVGALVSTTRSARRDGRRLVLVRGLPQVDRLLTLTGDDRPRHRRADRARSAAHRTPGPGQWPSACAASPARRRAPRRTAFAGLTAPVASVNEGIRREVGRRWQCDLTSKRSTIVLGGRRA